MTRLNALLLAAAGLCLLFPATSDAQRILRVHALIEESRGEASLIDTTLLHRLLSVRPGQRYEASAVERDLAALLATGLFDTHPYATRAAAQPEPGGIVLYYYLRPNPRVTGYAFPGAKSVPFERLREAVSPLMPIGQIYDSTAGQRAVRRLAGALEEADVAAGVDLPAIDSAGVVTFVVREHHVNRIRLDWIGTPTCREGPLLDRIPLRRFATLRPRLLLEAQLELEATGLFESVVVSREPPDRVGLADITISLKPRSAPAPKRREDLGLLDPGGVAQATKWVAPLRIEVPFDLTTPRTEMEIRRLAAEGTAESLLAAALAALEREDPEAALVYAQEGARVGGAEASVAGWAARLRCRTISGARGPYGTGPAADTPAERARKAFAVAEACLAELCDRMGCRPAAPASMRALAAAASMAPIPLAVDSAAYADAFDEATDMLLEQADAAVARSCLAEIEELVLSRELLRAFDRSIPRAPEPMRPFGEVAFGNRAVLEGLLGWRKEDRSSADCAYLLGLLALGRSFAETGLGAEGAAQARAYELGGAAHAAALSLSLLREASSSPDRERFGGLLWLQSLAALLVNPLGVMETGFARLVCDTKVAPPEPLVYAAVGPEGFAAGAGDAARLETARRLAAALQAEGSVRGLRLACLALLWAGDHKAARGVLEQWLEPAAPEAASTGAVAGLVALRSGEPDRAVEAFRRSLRALDRAVPEPDGNSKPLPRAEIVRLLGCALLAAGDTEAAASAFGVAG